jgi:hypothetical protein
MIPTTEGDTLKRLSHEEIRRDAIAAAERIGDAALAPSFPWTDQTSEAEENRVQLALAQHRASRARVMGTEDYTNAYAILPSDGYADGGTPYTDDELDA